VTGVDDIVVFEVLHGPRGGEAWKGAERIANGVQIDGRVAPGDRLPHHTTNGLA